jgi:hypothetical protein
MAWLAETGYSEAARVFDLLEDLFAPPIQSSAVAPSSNYTVGAFLQFAKPGIVFWANRVSETLECCRRRCARREEIAHQKSVEAEAPCESHAAPNGGIVDQRICSRGIQPNNQ